MADNGNQGISTILDGARGERRRLAGSSHAPPNLADLLERVLDKGIVIAGDITLSLGEIELLQIKIRLLIASVDRAREMGIDWWTRDPALCSNAAKAAELGQLAQRVDQLDTLLASLAHDRERQLSKTNGGAAERATASVP